MENIRFFLAGSIKKQICSLNIPKSFWTNEDEEYLKERLVFNVEILNPNTLELDKNDTEQRFRKDLELLLSSNIVIVDASERGGIGIGSEMMFAKMNNIPIFSICPKNSHYRTYISNGEEWIHPFIYELSDRIFDSIDQLVLYLNQAYELKGFQKKSSVNIFEKIDSLYSFDGGYDEGYKKTRNFWGESPAYLVQKAASLLNQKEQKDIICLDLGCGHGKNSIYLAKKGFQVTAIDASYYCIEEAKSLSNLVKWRVRDIRKIKPEDKKYDLILMTGSLHCLSTIDEIKMVIETAKFSTKIGGFNVISVFNDTLQDLAGHSSTFHPLLLKHEEYEKFYDDWKIIESSNNLLLDEHPHNHIKHKHSITRLLAQRIK